MSNTNLSPKDAILLQYIDEQGEEDVTSLAKELREPRGAVMARLKSLRQKGLVVIKDTYHGMLIQLSQRGKQTLRYMWPEMLTSAI